MERVGLFNELELWKYEPTLLKPFYINMEPLSVASRIRFLIDYIYGYRVYYIKHKGNFVGYCTITSGKNHRFWFANEKDIIVGPYYVDDKCRGKGFCKKMVHFVLNGAEKNWGKAYIYIKNSNIPSIRVAESLGAEMLFHVHNTPTRRLIKKEAGEYGVFMIENTNNS